ncbi:3-phosphoshikimate 1-carboxyvinyltransferase [Rhabdochromatium marinum]|uniref:3-phosphoshikimate 1-carboxyvinyltransferase n=1 Tax=Rhabdochromatium marinum TaxID=48729 RepID=UPI001F5B2161|nr:3-phosphoshikimate 1-carboxyvinyltransferase [Rhabdochromatium marinum]
MQNNDSTKPFILNPSPDADAQAETDDRRTDWRQDRILQPLLARMPPEAQDSFSPQQLEFLKAALMARTWQRHALDWRGTFKLWRYRYYVVFLLGRNRRQLTRGEQRIGLLFQMLFLIGFLGVSLLIGLLALYLLKSAAGVDLIPMLSLGIWDWFKEPFW